MTAFAEPGVWLRRARPLLGTLVEIGVPSAAGSAPRAIEQAFERVASVQQRLSRFEAASDVSRFHALRVGGSMPVHDDTATVLIAARQLQIESNGLFDISLGTGPAGWHCDDHRLTKLHEGVCFDLGGIGKGYAVDCAIESLVANGIGAGWVNAGGDLRAFGRVEVPVHLRNERAGGVRPFASLTEGAFATSCRAGGASAHVSVAAPQCLWADALTKVVALSGSATHPVIAHHQAQAWIH